MNYKKSLAALAIAAFSVGAQAQTEIQWWHSMGGALGEWVNDLAKDFNASQKDYKIVPTFKGGYDESMTAAIAAYRSGNAPHILQVFEVGTATMMASKGAIVPVGKVMQDAGLKFDQDAYVPAVSGYYTAPNGQMLSFPFNSSTPVFHYNKDAFKAAGMDPEKPPTTWPEVALAAAKLKASGHKCPFTTSWISWTQLESFSAWHNTEFATKGNGMRGIDARLSFNTPLHVRHIENLANMATYEVQTVGSTADKFKLGLAIVLAVASLAAFYVLSKQGALAQWGALIAGLAVAVVVFLLSETGKQFVSFGQDAVREVKKVVWPERKEAMQITAYVFVFVVVMALFLWLTDKTLEWVFYDLILGWKK